MAQIPMVYYMHARLSNVETTFIKYCSGKFDEILLSDNQEKYNCFKNKCIRNNVLLKIREKTYAYLAPVEWCTLTHR